MATIYLNEKRIKVILDRLLAHEQREVDQTYKDLTRGPFSLKMYFAVHPEGEADQISTMSGTWTKRADCLVGFYNVNDLYLHETFYFDKERPIAFPYSSNSVDIAILPKELQKEFSTLHTAWVKAVKESKDKHQIHFDTLKKYKTVNAIYKVWPSVLDFCDEAMLTQFDKPAERKTKEQLAEMAGEFLNTVATARILKDVPK